MPQPIDTCPKCGAKALTAACSIIVDYAINNDGPDAQTWQRQEITDDNPDVVWVFCRACKAEYQDATIEGGFLVALGEAEEVTS
jgi:hypothetical protein